MKKLLAVLLAALLLTGCGSGAPEEIAVVTEAPAEAMPAELVFTGTMVSGNEQIPYTSRFASVTEIVLSDEGIAVDGGGETDAVYTSRDIVYYEDRDTYDSGNPYGEGEAWERHTPEEAAAHTVVNITAPGAYRVSGTLSAGQIRVDLGKTAYEDPNAIVELILADAHITCTVAPAILFLNTYECDGNWSTDTAKAQVDTAAAGANLILEGTNTVTGSHVARIYKDQEGEKKLWKQDGAIYSYMSLNVFGPGKLDLTADNEGLDTELHLTVNGGDIAIRADNDGINTNEDGVSVTTINGGSLHIIAGLGDEGDGIDSNGYLVINGGTVVASANPAADAGLDSDMGSFINGGTVIALGSTMDWAESESEQVTMNLQFAAFQSAGSAIVVCKENGTVVFAYDPSEDEVLAENTRQYMGAILSCPGLTQGESYLVWLDGTLSGTETGGVYEQVADYANGTQMAYTGTDVTMGPGGMGGFGGGQRPGGQMPEDWQPSDGARPDRPEMPDGELPQMPEGVEPPEGFEGEIPEGGFGRQWPEGGFGGEKPEDFTLPEGETFPEEGFGGRGGMPSGGLPGEGNILFYMQDMVNCFSGIAAA